MYKYLFNIHQKSNKETAQQFIMDDAIETSTMLNPHITVIKC